MDRITLQTTLLIDSTDTLNPVNICNTCLWRFTSTPLQSRSKQLLQINIHFCQFRSPSFPRLFVHKLPRFLYNSHNLQIYISSPSSFTGPLPSNPFLDVSLCSIKLIVQTVLLMLHLFHTNESVSLPKVNEKLDQVYFYMFSFHWT